MTYVDTAVGRGDLESDPAHSIPRRTLGYAEGDLASKRIVVGFGFWVFLISDIIMFSAFFAAYVVLVDNTAGGPNGRELFNLTSVALETGCLLTSS